VTDPLNFKDPMYGPIVDARFAKLKRLRAKRSQFADLKLYYRDHPAQFISDWGYTFDPRNVERDLPTLIPFVLFRRQEEWVTWLLERWKNQEPGITEKSRESGMSWLSVAAACTLCLFNRGMVIGFGSRKEEYVDKIGNPKSLFEKARMFLSELPAEFLEGWSRDKHAGYMRILFPGTGSVLTGEAGDGIGRGDRTSLYFVDEAAFLEHPQLVDASLSATTNCRQDISTPNGMANSFAQRRHSGRIKVFTFSWRDDPRKGPDWYAKQLRELDPIVIAGEINIDYSASVENALIPMPWIQSAIGAHAKLCIEPTGERRGALDVADEGRDRCAFAGRHGVLLNCLKSWSGKGSTIFATSIKAFALCEEHSYPSFDFDSDGLGSGVRGDAEEINTQRRAAHKREIIAEPFRGSAAVYDPDGSLVEGRYNKDFFANLKAQAFWSLRLRFQATHRAVTEGKQVDPDDIISLDPSLEELPQLIQELSQPTYSINTVGKILIDKAPDGAMSPNLADAAMICFSPFRQSAYFAMAGVAMEPSVICPKVHEMPSKLDDTRTDLSLAVIIPVGSVIAVVYCTTVLSNNDGSRPNNFVIMDWDLRVVDPQLEQWIHGVQRHLVELNAQASKTTVVKLYCDSYEEGYAEYLRQRGLPAEAVSEELPPLKERGNRAQPYLNCGLVTVARPAWQRELTFRGVKRNFLREILDQLEPPQSPLLLALSTAVLIKYHGEPALPPKSPPKIEAPQPQEAPVPTPSGVWLKPGKHTINGSVVNVPIDGDRDLVFYEIAPGRHTIDHRIAYVSRPGVGGIKLSG
jgi:phage terminase large subunit